MELELLLTYLVAITLLTITPGVDTLLTIRNSARGGWRDGAVTSFGICSGLFIHATVSAVGISVILMQTAWAFSALKLIGAGYLIWLGLNSWRAVLRGKQTLLNEGLPPASGGFDMSRSLREGFLSNVLNPKTAIFYMAFLPQFIDPAGSAFWQSITLAAIHFLIAMLWQCGLALMVNRAKELLQRPRVNRTFGGLTGSVMILMGLRLAVTD
ncbi:LysE family translocator [Marinobacterium arenosum]|uniref:LysE family translocator n=1 Tax=Marinobacterium arenosum TaxID=2862496 RepID=UPI001C949766|nr:LysE family translocator [Marinobacterium arenosum]MBY4675574.1 LysE family translocator [Marinobacterium arenosum]